MCCLCLTDGIFQENSIGQRGAGALARALEDAPWIDSLILASNKIEDQGATAFGLAIPKVTFNDAFELLLLLRCM